MAAYKNKVRVAAHRGNSCVCPENTLVAMRSALELPVDMLEIDLHMTKDGHIILMHDHAVDRTTDHTGLIRDYTLARIRAMDAGSWKGEAFRGERVPLFEEFLELLKDYPDMTFNVELKDYPLEWRTGRRTRRVPGPGNRRIYDCARRAIWHSRAGLVQLLERRIAGIRVDAAYGHRYKLHGYFPFELMHGVKTRAPYDYLHCVCLFGTGDAPVVAKEEFDRAKACGGVEPWCFFPGDQEEYYEGAIANGCMLLTCNHPAKASPICGNEDCTIDICGFDAGGRRVCQPVKGG